MAGRNDLTLNSTTQNQDTIDLGPWSKGMSNRQPAYALLPDTVRYAQNGDFDLVGKFRRRVGYQKVDSGTQVHSGYSNGTDAFIVEAGNLYRWSPTGKELVVSGITGRVAYATARGVVYWSDGTLTGRIINGINKAWGIEPPVFNTGISVTSGTGAFTLATTFIRNDGVESGISNNLSGLCATGSALTIASLPVSQDPDVISVNVYGGSGDVLYLLGTYPAGAQSVTVSLTGAGKPHDGMVKTPPPPSSQILEFAGRLFMIVGDMVVFTEPYDYEKIDPVSGYMQFPSDVTMIAQVTSATNVTTSSGLYVATRDRTWFFNGTNPTEFHSSTVFNYGAVAGTMVPMPNTNDVMWYSTRGAVRGSERGQAVNLQDALVAVSQPGAGVGAAMIREYKGLRMYVSTVPSSNPTEFLRSGT